MSYKKALLSVLVLLCALLAPIPMDAQEGSPGERLPYAIADTGQARCFGVGREMGFPAAGRPYAGQDAQYQGNGPSYRDNGDSTVTDLVTGLTWQKTPDFQVRTWEEARAYAEKLTLAGKSDWRVPTMKELFSIADFRGTMRDRRPYIDTKVFDFRYPDPASGQRDMDAQYWSSNKYVGFTMRGDTSVFGFNFADGRIKSYPIAFGRGGRQGVKKYVRCVRGAAYGKNDFKDNGDGIVTDRATGLTWTKADSGKPMDWKAALAYAEALKLAGHDDWRLPNVKELQTLVDYTRAPDARNAIQRGPAIDPLFQLTKTESWFWTSTTHIENQFAYYVCFGQAFSAWTHGGRKMNAHGAGAVRSDPKEGDPADWAAGHGPQGDEIRILNYVRCVRGGAATPVASGPTAVLFGSGDFSVVTVGTGSPKYNPDRSGPCALVRHKSTFFLVDMGNGTQGRLNEAGISLGDIDVLAFTHHHLDHNEESTPILVRTRLQRSGKVVLGTPGTKALVDFVLTFFAQDLAYRAAKSGRTLADLGHPEVRELSGGEDLTLEGVKIRTAKVVHTIHTIAYRFDAAGASIVISGDTCYSEDLVTLAKNADILVMDSGGVVYKSRPGGGGRRSPNRPRGGSGGNRKKDRAHCTIEEVGLTATKAGVKKLVLVHFGPGQVDEDASRKAMAAQYKGEIIFARDLCEYVPGKAGGTAGAGSGTGQAKPGPGKGSSNRFIRRLDKDGDGKVSREEFDGPSRGFDRRDKNGDGFIDEKEAPSGPPGGGRGGGGRGGGGRK